jgi:hypothetical protein
MSNDKPSSMLAQFHAAKKVLCNRVVLPESFCGKSVAQVESAVAPHSSGLKPNGSATLLSHARKRPSPLAVRFSETELEIVKAKAKTAGCTTNSYVRASVLGSSYKPPANPELTKALLGLNREFTAQGNNLNQIARRVNGTQASEAEADSLLGMLARSMLRTHRAIRDALSWGKDGERP